MVLIIFQHANSTLFFSESSQLLARSIAESCRRSSLSRVQLAHTTGEKSIIYSVYNNNINRSHKYTAEMANTAPIGRSRSRSNSSTGLARSDKFPSKLYEMLESVDSLGLSHMVSWLPHGRSFHVKDPTQFMDLVVPKFFKATKYRSFQRQLNLWGFSR